MKLTCTEALHARAARPAFASWAATYFRMCAVAHRSWRFDRGRQPEPAVERPRRAGALSHAPAGRSTPRDRQRVAAHGVPASPTRSLWPSGSSTIRWSLQTWTSVCARKRTRDGARASSVAPRPRRHCCAACPRGPLGHWSASSPARVSGPEALSPTVETNPNVGEDTAQVAACAIRGSHTSPTAWRCVDAARTLGVVSWARSALAERVHGDRAAALPVRLADRPGPARRYPALPALRQATHRRAHTGPAPLRPHRAVRCDQNLPGYGGDQLSLPAMPDELAPQIVAWRASAAGRHALRVYQEHRRISRGV